MGGTVTIRFSKELFAFLERSKGGPWSGGRSVQITLMVSQSSERLNEYTIGIRIIDPMNSKIISDRWGDVGSDREYQSLVESALVALKSEWRVYGDESA